MKTRSRSTSVRIKRGVGKGTSAKPVATRSSTQLLSPSMRDSRKSGDESFPLARAEVRALHSYLIGLGWLDREDIDTYEIVRSLIREWNVWLKGV